jgi:(1->4)-alpha-D-glucan 1-alpha-D-glucosylmutase
LSQKVIQLAMPGVPDVYQGTELELLALVDPDNRRPVNYEERLARLARLDEGEPPADLNDEKLLVTSTLLRLRRDHPSWFVGDTATYAGWPAPEGVLAFVRGDDTGPQFLVAAAVKGAMAVDRDAIDLPIEGTWRLLWSDTVPVLAWVRDE